jgi:hypothetical protein
MTGRTPREWLRRKAQRGFQGHPLGTVAFYGPDDQLATKAVVGIVHRDGEDVRELEKWISEVSDVRYDHAIGHQVLAFLQKHAVQTVVIGPGILGCAHEEGIDYPDGEACPRCPYWAGRERPI